MHSIVIIVVFRIFNSLNMFYNFLEVLPYAIVDLFCILLFMCMDGGHLHYMSF